MRKRWKNLNSFQMEKKKKKKKTNCWPALQTQGDRDHNNRWYCSSTFYWSASKKTKSHSKPNNTLKKKMKMVTKLQIWVLASLHTSNTEILARLGPFFSRRSFFSCIQNQTKKKQKRSFTTPQKELLKKSDVWTSLTEFQIGLSVLQKKKKWGKRWHSQNYKTIRKRLGGRGLTNQRFRYGMFVHRRKHRPAICPWTSSPPAKKRFTHMNWLPIELQHSWRWLQKKIETVRRWEWEEQCRRNHLGSRISDWLIRRRFRIQDDEDGGGCWSSEASAASLIGATP